MIINDFYTIIKIIYYIIFIIVYYLEYNNPQFPPRNDKTL